MLAKIKVKGSANLASVKDFANGDMARYATCEWAVGGGGQPLADLALAPL
jgi:hypothetical protein